MTRARLIATLVIVLVVAYAWKTWRAPARVLYRGGTIITMDPAQSAAEALVVEGDRIVAVGRAVDLQPWVDRGARVVELQGRTLVPGFIDAHSHFPGSGLYAVAADLNSPPVGEVRRLADVVDRLRVQAAQTSAGRWVLGVSYDDSLLQEKRHPTRADLDQVSTTQPVAAVHVSGHLAAVNSKGLAVLGIGPDTPDPVGGRIQRDPESHAPTGVLEENAMDGVSAVLLHASTLDSVRMVRRASADYLAHGVTTAQNGYATLDGMNALSTASRVGIVPLRLILWPSDTTADGFIAGRDTYRSYDERWVRRGAVKLVADGSIQGYTAYLTQPYFRPPENDPTYRGYPRIAPDALRRAVSRYHALGLQVAVHGNGDAEIDDILDAIEAAQREHPRLDARPVIVHAQMARDDQLDRMQALGVVPSFFVLHTYYWGDRHREIFLGPDRTARISPTQSAVRRGIRFTLHADTPVTPMEPLRIVWAAVNRRSTSGVVVGPDERIDVLQALRGVTLDAAYQHFEEDEKGSLAVGKLADLVILDRSPLDDPEHIDQIRVLETIIGGRSVYRAPS